MPAARYRIATHRARAWIQPHLGFSANLAFETAPGLTILGCQLSPAQDLVSRSRVLLQGLKFKNSVCGGKIYSAELRSHRFDPSYQNATRVTRAAWPMRAIESV